MCGRYVVLSDPEQLAAWAGADAIRDEAATSYNVAPTMEVPAVIDRTVAADEGDEPRLERRLGTLSWGFVPFWSKDPRKRRQINARVEGVATSSMFKDSFARRRCLLPADGFYEWQKHDDGTKTPWFIHHPDREPLAFAGIWSSWRRPDDAEGPIAEQPERLYSAAILTTAAEGRMVDLHHRMPVILPRRLWDEWLHGEVPVERLQQVVAGAGTPALAAYAVSDRVNNVRNDAPDLLDAA